MLDILPRIPSIQSVSGCPPRNRLSVPAITNRGISGTGAEQAGQDSARVNLAAGVSSRHRVLVSLAALSSTHLHLHLHPLFPFELRSTDDLGYRSQIFIIHFVNQDRADQTFNMVKEIEGKFKVGDTSLYTKSWLVSNK